MLSSGCQLTKALPTADLAGSLLSVVLAPGSGAVVGWGVGVPVAGAGHSADPAPPPAWVLSVVLEVTGPHSAGSLAGEREGSWVPPPF